MNRIWCASFAFVVLLAPGQLAAQQAAPTPARDSQALALISGFLNASGGASAINEARDFSASGKIVFHWADEDVSGTATLKCRGMNQLKLEATLPDGHPRWIINEGAGRFVDLQGDSHPIPVRDAQSLASSIFPLMYLARVVSDERVAVGDMGVVDYNGTKAHEIEIRGLASDRNPNRINEFRRFVFIDPNTGMLLSILDESWTGGLVQVTHEVRYADFAVVQGIMVPMSISDFVGGQHTFDLKLQQVSFHSGLGSSEFDVE